MVFGLVSAMVLLIAAPVPAVVATGHAAAFDMPMAPQGVFSQHVDQEQDAVTAPVDVNRADKERLQMVPGIGPATAGRIIDWRNEHGRFERLEDLLNIRGIGVTTLEKLRPYVTVGTPDGPEA